MLEGVEGNVGVDGPSELDGDIGWERSSARTTSAGVPLGTTFEVYQTSCLDIPET